jgi:hypothetical protein
MTGDFEFACHLETSNRKANKKVAVRQSRFLKLTTFDFESPDEFAEIVKEPNFYAYF